MAWLTRRRGETWPHNGFLALTEGQNPNMPGMARANLHLDILMGRDESLDVTDFFGGTRTLCCTFAALSCLFTDVERVPVDMRAEMERRRRIM